MMMIKAFKMLRRLLWLVALAGLAVMVVRELPALRRELKLEKM